MTSTLCVLNFTIVLGYPPVLMTTLHVLCADTLSQVDGGGFLSSANALVRLLDDTASFVKASSPVGFDLSFCGVWFASTLPCDGSASTVSALGAESRQSCSLAWLLLLLLLAAFLVGPSSWGLLFRFWFSRVFVHAPCSGVHDHPRMDDDKKHGRISMLATRKPP